MNIVDIFPALRGTGAPKLPPTKREPSHTKAGPGHRHVTGNGKQKTAKQKAAGSFGRGLRNHFTRMNAQRTAKRLAREQAIAYGRTPRN